MLVAPKPGVLLHPTWTRRISEFTGRLAPLPQAPPLSPQAEVPAPSLRVFPLASPCPGLRFAFLGGELLIRAGLAHLGVSSHSSPEIRAGDP